MAEKSINEQINSMTPKSLDDIIRLNSHVAKLKPANQKDLKAIESSFPITNLRGTFKQAFVYKFEAAAPYPSFLALVGHKVEGERTSTFHTSVLEGYDLKTNAFVTKSGSHYVVQEFIEPDDEDLLVQICCWLNKSASGRYFGVPEWFA